MLPKPIRYKTPIYTFMTLGTFLRQLRQARNLSQQEVAIAIPVSQSTYSEWESDVRIPKTKHLILLSKEFRVTLKEFTNYISKEELSQESEVIQLKAEIVSLRQREEQYQATIQALQSRISPNRS